MRRKRNPHMLPTRKQMMDNLVRAHGYFRNFVTDTEAYGREFVVPLTDSDIRSIADACNEMREDIKFVKKYYGV